MPRTCWSAPSPAERREFEEPLARCSTCQSAVSELAAHHPGLLAQVLPADAAMLSLADDAPGAPSPSPRCSLSPCLHPFGESDPPSDPGRSSPRGSLSHKILLAAATVPDIVLTSFPTAITLTEAKPGPRNLRRSPREEIPGGQRSGAPSHDPAATATATTRARSPRENTARGRALPQETPRRPPLARHDQRRTTAGGEPGRTTGGGSAIQRGWLNPNNQLFGQVTSQTRQPRLYDDQASRWTNTEAPKSSDLSLHSAQDLDWVAAELNDRPRKRLGFKKPIEQIGPLLLR
jgi:hypothetical protein